MSEAQSEAIRSMVAAENALALLIVGVIVLWIVWRGLKHKFPR